MTIKDMTKGNPTGLILRFALPLFIGNLFQQFYNIIDTIIVGRTLGIDSLAAVGATGAIAFFVIGFIFGTTSGFSVVTAQRFGAKDISGVRKSFACTIILSILLTIILTILSTKTTYWLLAFMNTPPNIIEQAFQYIYIIYLGIGTIIFYNTFSNAIRALGDSKTPLTFLIIASILNIILDLIFIIKLNLGVSGAAWATVVAQGFSALICLLYIFIKFPILRLKKSDWFVSVNFLLEHIRIGLPMGLQMSVLTIGIIAVQSILNTFGSTTIAAYTAAIKVDQCATQIFLAIGTAMATYTAQNYGAGLLNRIRTGAKNCMVINLIFSLIGAILIFSCGKYMIGLFIDGHNQTMLEQAQTYLYINMVFYYALATLLLYRNILQGVGSAMIPLMSGTLELVMRVAAAFVLGHYLGYLGICISTPCAWVSAAIWLTWGYRKTMRKLVLLSPEKTKDLSFIALDN